MSKKSVTTIAFEAIVDLTPWDCVVTLTVAPSDQLRDRGAGYLAVTAERVLGPPKSQDEIVQRPWEPSRDPENDEATWGLSFVFLPAGIPLRSHL